MIRLFNVYYPLRVLVLVIGEAFVVGASFLLSVMINLGPDSYLVLNYEHGFFKILLITATFLLLSHYFDLYDPQRLGSNSEIYFRLFIVVGAVSFLLAGIGYFSPDHCLGSARYFSGC